MTMRNTKHTTGPWTAGFQIGGMTSRENLAGRASLRRRFPCLDDSMGRAVECIDEALASLEVKP